MKDHPIQSPKTDRRNPAGRILREAVLVAVVGAVFAFAANQVSPRGLSLARNYFPTGLNDAMRASASAHPPEAVAGTNSTTPSSPPSLAVQMQQKGLQLIDGHQAVQFFHDSHLKSGTIAFLDARDDEHYLAGHIPGACQFDPYHPEKYFPAVLPVCQAAEHIVIYCHGGDCDDSQTAALLLRDVGVAKQKLFIFAGGITEWTNNHQPLETGARNSGNLSVTIQ
ncbi:MAG TPA: rhodanese-like domain-containing protein [Verrucomicrobiae bacterium]|nr:rhodanese-like domain-containing protein [Verrucomicrobiae bacterium]